MSDEPTVRTPAHDFGKCVEDFGDRPCRDCAEYALESVGAPTPGSTTGVDLGPRVTKGYSPLRRWLRQERERDYWLAHYQATLCDDCGSDLSRACWRFGDEQLCRDCGWKRISPFRHWPSPAT